MDPDTELSMVALARDPTTIFVYWVPDEEKTAALRAAMGERAEEAQWILRLTQLELGAVSDVPVEFEARNWYVGVMAGSTYETELGLLDAAGDFYRLCAFGPVRMPPLSYSHLYDKQWMIREEDFLRLLSLAGSGPVGSSAFLADVVPVEEVGWAAEAETPPETAPSPTSPGVPDYRGRSRTP